MPNLPAQIAHTIRKYGMLARGDRVLVALSGGPDSICLLSVLRALADDLDLALHIAHLNHRFRGEESAREAIFVERLADSCGIPATVGQIDVPAYCRERGLSAQAGARELRYAFLREAARAAGAGKIAVGHTADDQAETLLLRMIRGAGTPGLAAIPPVRDDIIRPLIETTRQEIMSHLKEHRLDFVVDSSNFDNAYTRNRIRQEVLPVLERFNPRIITTLATEASLLRDDNMLLNALFDPLVVPLVRSERDSIRLDRKQFLNLVPAGRRRLLRRVLAEFTIPHDDGLSAVQTEDAIAFMAGAQTGRTMELPHGIHLRREYEAFVLERGTAEVSFNVELPLPGTSIVPETSLEMTTEIFDVQERREATGNYLWQAAFDYDKITPPLYLRSRRDGDRIRPAGFGGHSKKLQDILVDRKIPRSERSRVPVLATDRDILGIVGLLVDGRFLPGPGTRKILVVTAARTTT